MTKRAIDYAAASLELEEILGKLQQPGLQVDEALKLYEQGLKLVHELESYLATAENKIEQLKLAAHGKSDQGPA